MAEGPRAAKCPKRECSYQTEWKIGGVSASGGGGVNDVKKHLATTKHQEMVKHSSGNQCLRTLFEQSPIEESVTQAEVLFANFVTEHNLSFYLADYFTHLTSVMFPDNKIAKSFRSARTKMTCCNRCSLPTF